jgi:hypothetical protein
MSDEEIKQSNHCEAFVIFSYGSQISRDMIKAYGEYRKYTNDSRSCNYPNNSVPMVSMAAQVEE